MTPLADTDWAAVPTPALTVDVARLDANIQSTATTFAQAGLALRPHFKTSKCLEVAQRQRAAGAAGFACSTPAEAQALADAGFSSVLWAHQPVGPGKPELAAALAAGPEPMTSIVDSLAVAAPLAAAATAAGVRVPYLLEVDTGQGRTGVIPDQALAVVREIARLPALELRGVMTHEGHLSAFRGDRPGLDAAGARVGELLVAVADGLRQNGFACPIVSVGSTPGMRSAPFAPGVTEARPGTYVYYDGNQVRLGSCEWDQCASSVLTRVVSVNRAGSAIIDAGLKALSADAMSAELGSGELVNLAGERLADLRFVSANEEHGFVEGPGTQRLSVGDLLRVIPHHACGATNMWSRLLAVHPDGQTQWWPIVGRH